MKDSYLKADTKDKKQYTKDKKYQPHMHGRDANSHLIFSNPVLTCQFLKGYTGISLFQDLTPDDIEDVTERYKAFLGVEFETDTVKRIRIRLDGQEKEVYVISLIEHKSYVDYDIAMQLLRYMTVIWHDYKVKRNKEKDGISRQMSFRYPLIIPIVYYEGAENWTADLHLLDRIEGGEQMRKYLPDFEYKVVRLHDYTNDELQKMNDEMSLVMMINRVQSEQDYQEFLNITKKVIVTIYQNASPDLQEIYQEILWTLLMQMKVPQKQANEMMEGLGVKGMGYLFENLKGIDIGKMQEESRELQKSIKKMRDELTDTQSQLSDTQSQLTDTQSQLTDTQSQLLQEKKRWKNLGKNHAKRLKAQKFSRQEAISQLMEFFDFSEEEAIEIIEQYW